MATFKKKIWPEEFEAIKAGRKTFELRNRDFEVNEGDTLVLKEWDPKTEAYTEREAEKKVGYVFKFHPHELPYYPKEEVERDGLQIISLL